jgi:hypothetical protein
MVSDSQRRLMLIIRVFFELSIKEKDKEKRRLILLLTS